jgi:hypothetical protein
MVWLGGFGVRSFGPVPFKAMTAINLLRALNRAGQSFVSSAD